MRSVRDAVVAAGVDMAERGLPDRAIRWGMRKGIERRLREEVGRPESDRRDWLRDWATGPIALVPDLANRQHYEVPVAFFERLLGPRLKYSCALFEDGVDDLAAAEEAMLDLTCRRAGIEDGMRILDLGSGWGSLSLWIAEHFPACTVVAVSNSEPQGRLIVERAATRGLGNVVHHVADVNRYAPDVAFDRVVSVEMMEHVRNHPVLLGRIADWLEPGGALFVHVFAHRSVFWPFEDRGPGDWMTRSFFSGGLMPSHDFFERVASPFAPVASHWIDGMHYQRTLEAWLDRLDADTMGVAATLEPAYGTSTSRWVQRWRMFLMACSELFGYDAGREWGVSHHLLHPKPTRIAGVK